MDSLASLRKLIVIGLGAIALLVAACAAMSPVKTLSVVLTGAEEVPPVVTAGTATGSFMVAENMSVSGSLATSGLDATAAHIHMGVRGENGPIAIGLVKTGDNVWSVAPGAKFNESQYANFLAGRTYVNVHTPANKSGEIRAQLQP